MSADRFSPPGERVVPFPAHRVTPRSTPLAAAEAGRILLFTGVRYERHDDPPRRRRGTGGSRRKSRA